MNQPDITIPVRTFRRWARQHRRLSTGTIRRRFRVTPEEAEAVMREMLRLRVLYPEPEGDSYRVRYPHAPKPELWWAAPSRTYTYPDRG